MDALEQTAINILMLFLLILTQVVDFPAIFAIFCNLRGTGVEMISKVAEVAKKITDKLGWSPPDRGVCGW
jgi:hypothetical protein